MIVKGTSFARSAKLERKWSEMSDDSKNYIDIVFDDGPGPVSGRFVEVENEAGESICVGEWVKRDDGYWALRITQDSIINPRKEMT